jgi:hypothetical protein
MFVRDLLLALSRSAIRYSIVGGVAVNLHGVPRLTYDVDIVVLPEAGDLAATEALLVGMGLRCRLPLSLPALADPSLRQHLRDERNLLAVTFTDPADPLREVDVLVSPPVDAVQLLARAVEMNLDGAAIKVVSLADLVALKRASGRAQDMDDARYLERVLADDAAEGESRG